jgi:hypothetical protein
MMNMNAYLAHLHAQRALAAPGPWRVEQYYSDAVTVVDANGFEHVEITNVAIVPDWEKLGLEHWSEDGGSRDVSMDEQRANATLAAAAPVLLAHVSTLNAALEDTRSALRHLLRLHEQVAHLCDDDLLLEIQDAISDASRVLARVSLKGGPSVMTHADEGCDNE